MDSDNKPISILVAGSYQLDDRFLKMLRYAESYGGNLTISGGAAPRASGFKITEINIDELLTPDATGDFDLDDRPSSAPANLPSHNWNYLKLRKGKY